MSNFNKILCVVVCLLFVGGVIAINTLSVNLFAIFAVCVLGIWMCTILHVYVALVDCLDEMEDK